MRRGTWAVPRLESCAREDQPFTVTSQQCCAQRGRIGREYQHGSQDVLTESMERSVQAAVAAREHLEPIGLQDPAELLALGGCAQAHVSIQRLDLRVLCAAVQEAGELAQRCI